MTARPLNEAVQQAEEAISGGNYQLAVETCRRVLGQFPEFATAHRLLAEAHLEAGDVDAAAQAFQETLQRDPQSSPAYAGLATIAERRGDVEGALAYAQVAWEIMPNRADLRDRVASLSERLYGKGGRLHLTRPALTSLHFRAGRWSRAAAEAASVLIEHPSRVDVQLRMAEALWRRGNLPAAANACRAVLDSAPSAVMALLMLADVERRHGDQDAAAQLLERARAIDPDGVRAADLVTVGATDLAEFILPAQMPEFDDSAEVTAEVERPRIAPAPDFSWTQPAHEETGAATAGTSEEDSLVAEAPAAAQASAASAGDDFDVSLPDDAEIDAARPPAETQHGYTSMLESLEGEGLTPFRLEGDEGESPAGETEVAAELDQDDDVFNLVSDEELEAARPPSERPRGYTTLLNSLDESGVAPFEIEGAPGYPTEDEASAGVEASSESVMPADTTEPVDYGADLTAGWDDIDAEIQRATPSGDDALKGYTGELRDLDEIGVQPFSIEGVGHEQPGLGAFEDEVDVHDVDTSDLSFLDEPQQIEGVAPAVESMALDMDLTDGWATIDEEIQNAIPNETPPGYTDELNQLTVSGVEPFFVEAEETEGELEDQGDQAAVVSEEDVVSDELAAGIELWSFDDEPVESMVEAAEPSTFEGEAAKESEVEAETEPVSTAELFDFADSERAEETSGVAYAEPEPSPWESTAEELEPVEMVAQAEVPTGDELVEPVAEIQDGEAIRATITRLGVDAALFERARQEKVQLIESGRIEGNQLLPGVEPPGPSLEELEWMVQENPDDLGTRRQFIAALLEAGEFERGFAELQWMFRARQPFDEQDVSNLARVAEEYDARQVASHRLLGAVYRRAGNLGMSAHHYQLSLAGDRGGVEKEA